MLTKKNWNRYLSLLGRWGSFSGITAVLLATIQIPCALGQTAPTVTPVDGSTPPAIAGGQPAGSYALSGFETVNIFNGNLNFRLPLVSMKGRGGVGIEIVLPIERHWMMEVVPPSVSGNYTSYAAIERTSSPPYSQDYQYRLYSAGTLSVREIGTDLFTNCSSGAQAMYQTTLTRLTFTEPDGTEHEFVDALSGGYPVITNPFTYEPTGQLLQCPGLANTDRGRVWVSRDSTFSSLVLDNSLTDGTSFTSGPPVPTSSRSGGLALSGYMYTKDGTVYHLLSAGNVDWIRDRNGNKVSYTYGANQNDPTTFQRVVAITDSLNRQVTISYAPSGTAGGYDSIIYPSFNGGQKTVKVHYCFLDPVAAGMSCANYTGPSSQNSTTLFGSNIGGNGTFNPIVVSYVELPDSRTYQMSYDAYGELTKVRLPTGGSFQYTYGAGDPSQSVTDVPNSGVIGLYNQGAGLQVYRRVQQRSVYLSDSIMEGKTIYQPSYIQNCVPSVPASGVTFCTTVGETQQDASGNVLAAKRHWFYGGANDPTTYFADGNWYPKWTEGREYQTDFLNTSGTFNVTSAASLQTQTQYYEQRPCTAGEHCPTSASVYLPSPIDVRLREVDTALKDVIPNLVSKEIYSSFDQFNNVMEKDEYGFDGSIYRKNITSYFSSKSIGGVSWDYRNTSLASGVAGNYGSIVHIRNLPMKQQIMDASNSEVARTTFDYDNYSLASASNLVQWDSSVPPARGNVTTKSAWLLTESRSLDTNYTYDVAGNVASVIDPKKNQTSVTYSGAYNSAFPTQVTFALGSQYYVQTAYDFNTGKPTSFTDMNGNPRNYRYNDILDRLTEVDLPDGGVTAFGYCDVGSSQACPSTGTPANSVTKTEKQNSCSTTNSIVSDVLYDGLGRTAKTHAYEEAGSIVVQTQYDGMGRKFKVSHPMRTESPTDFTTTLFDALGRVQTLTEPDGSVSQSIWSGSAVTLQDPAGSTRTLVHDAFGRVVKVTEDPNGTPFDTNYRYDLLDNLLGVCHGGVFSGNPPVCQGNQNRTFLYDSLKRLTSATNPESGTMSYSYDDSGNLRTKQDSRGHIICYGSFSGQTCGLDGYDPINRLLKKRYLIAGSSPDGVVAPDVSYVWDTVSKGYLSSVSSTPSSGNSLSSITNYLAYDSMGRVTKSSQTTNGQTYTFSSYGYNLAGGLETEVYPSGRSMQNCYDPAGREFSVNQTVSGVAKPYASSVTYAPHGAIQSFLMGNQLTESRVYNNRLQPTSISVGTSASSRVGFGADLYYCPNKTATCLTNNGNLKTESISILGVDQTFGYDSRNRLNAASESGSSWAQSYGYDFFGNRWVPSGAINPFTPVASTNFDGNNRLQIQGTVYDAAGNQKQIGGYTSVWDSEERMVSNAINGTQTNYSYDGDGHRVAKQAGGQTTIYVYDAQGMLAAEYATNAPAPACATCYLSYDHLGSTRLVTDASQKVVARHDYLPFGEEVPSIYGGRSTASLMYAATDGVTEKFTGKERDAESGLDYFGARYYGSALGRFTSPDPLMASAHASNPQSWNRYAYTLNNPLRFIDPDGMDVPATCAQDKNCQIVVKVNVIYDKTVNNGKGFTNEQKAAFEKDQVAKAQKDFGNSNIKLDVTYTQGSFTVNDNGKPVIEGLKADSLNIVASTASLYGHNGESGQSGGTAITFLRINDLNNTNWFGESVTTEHELAHQFLGDPFTTNRNPITNATRDTNIDIRNTFQGMGVSQSAYREGLEPRRYAVPANPEAIKPQK